jgi:transcriptional regulator with XRE-family HTH domain
MAKGAFATTLRVLRAERGYSLTNASKKIGLDRHTLRQLELGQREPYYGTLRKIAAGYGVEINDLVGTSAEEAQSPLAEAENYLRMSTVAGEDFSEDQRTKVEVLRTSAEAFVERWGGTASAVKSIQSKDKASIALLSTVEWAVMAEANTLFREFLTLPQVALRLSKVHHRVRLCKMIGEVAKAADDLRMVIMAIEMDATGRKVRSVSPLYEEEAQEYFWLRSQAVDHAAVVGHPSSGTGLGEGGVERINRIPE